MGAELSGCRVLRNGDGVRQSCAGEMLPTQGPSNGSYLIQKTHFLGSPNCPLCRPHPPRPSINKTVQLHRGGRGGHCSRCVARCKPCSAEEPLLGLERRSSRPAGLCVRVQPVNTRPSR